MPGYLNIRIGIDNLMLGTDVPGMLEVSGAQLSSVGEEGSSSYLPSSTVHTLTNSGTTSINWTATKTEAWVTLSSASGTLAAGASTTVTVSINTAQADLLDVGAVSDIVTFTNTTNGRGSTTRSVSLNVTSVTGYAESVVKDGITWEFSESTRVGQYANGDWWAVGPCTITSITRPNAADGYDGSMVNPVAGNQGYDDNPVMGEVQYSYSAALNVANSLPLTLDPSGGIKSLVSVISRAVASTADRPEIEVAAVLTVVASVPAATALRPNYMGTTKLELDADDINMGVLPSWPALSGTPTVAAMEALLEKCRLQGAPECVRERFWHPRQAMSNYGRDIANEVGEALCLLCIDEDDLGGAGSKDNLAILVCQLGIDTWGAVHNGCRHNGNGGHGIGWKAPVLVAGKLLNDPDLLDIGNDFPAVDGWDRFAEDTQTFEIDAAEVSRLLDVQVSITVTSATSTTVTGTLNRQLLQSTTPIYAYMEVTSGGAAVGQVRLITDSSYADATLAIGASLRLDCDPADTVPGTAWTTTPSVGDVVTIRGYQSADIGTAEWGIRFGGDGVGESVSSGFSGLAVAPQKNNPGWKTDYRQITQYALPGHALVALALDLRTEWNHEPFFDYMDRYWAMTAPSGTVPGYQSLSTFVKNLWNAHRSEFA